MADLKTEGTQLIKTLGAIAASFLGKHWMKKIFYKENKNDTPK